MRRTLPLCLLALSCVWGCSSNNAEEAEDPRPRILATVTDDVILPRYATFETEAEAMAQASADFCEAPDAEGLAKAKRSWEVARDAWKRTEVFAFGPYREYPERFGTKIDSWPVRQILVEDTLFGTEPITAESLKTSAVATRGLPVVEFLLFRPDDPLVEFSAGGRRCEYLIAATADVSDSATALHDAWALEQGGFALQVKTPGEVEDGMFMNTQEALSEVVNRMWFTVENARRDKLGKPLGESSGGKVQPDSVESPYSGHSVEDIIQTLVTLETLVEVEGGLATHPRLSDDLLADFRSAYSASIDALEAIPRPLSEAVVEDPDSVRAAHEALAELQRVIQTDMINTLNLQISFNDADGD